MTYSKFMEMLQRDTEEKVQLQVEISDLQKEEAALEEKMKAAADAGDTDTYLALSAEKDTVAKKIFVKSSFQKKRGSLVNEDGAKGAWKDYVSGYNKKLKSSIAAFEEEKKKLCAMYSELVSIQNEALKVREHLCEVTGLNNPESFEMAYIPFINGSDPGTIKLGNLQCFDTDLVYFAACLEASSGMRIALNPNSPEALKSQHFYNVVVRHKSC